MTCCSNRDSANASLLRPFLPLCRAWSAPGTSPGRRALATRHAAQLRHVLLAFARTAWAGKDAVAGRAASATTKGAARCGREVPAAAALAFAGLPLYLVSAVDLQLRVPAAAVAAAPGAANAFHGKVGRRGRVEQRELLLAEEARQEQGADGDEGEDEDGEADGGDGLGNGKRGGEAEELDGDEPPDGGAARDGAQGRGRRREVAVAGEVHDLGGDAVGLESLEAHDEEEAGEDAVGDEVQDDEQGPRHGAEGEEALGEVGDALLDDVGGFEGEVALVVALFVELLDGPRDAERLGVEGRLRDEAIGKGQAEDARDAGRQAEEEEVPVEAGGLAEGELAALGDERRDWEGC